MADQANGVFPRTHSSLRRLETAIQRLESAVTQSKHGDLLLADELRAARAEYEALQGVTQAISGRLDAAIDRLRTVLEEG